MKKGRIFWGILVLVTVITYLWSLELGYGGAPGPPRPLPAPDPKAPVTDPKKPVELSTLSITFFRTTTPPPGIALGDEETLT